MESTSAPDLGSAGRRLESFRDAAVARRVTTRGLAVEQVPRGQLLSIVTVTFNSAATLERTIASVLAQTYPYVEHVIIDGGSTDGTLDIIRRYESGLAYWHSGRDGGISDAFNMGIAATTGDFIALVNSDDWMSPEQGQLAVAALQSSGAAYAFGRLAYHGTGGELRYFMDGDPDYRRYIHHRMPGVNHPTVVATRAAYRKVGVFDTRMRIAMDYDWLLRLELAGLRGVYEPRLLGHMSEGGACFVDWSGGLREVRDAAIRHRQSTPMAIWSWSSRLVRGHVREFLRTIFPGALVDSLHRVVNPAYRPAKSSTTDRS